MKKLFLAVVVLVMTTQFTNAQEQNKFRVGIDFGYATPQEGGGGASIALEPKYNIADNMNVGLRIESAAMARQIGSTEADVSSSFSYTGTFDYYFNSGNSIFAPFIGAGVGYNSLGKIGGLGSETFGEDNSFAAEEIKVDGKFGGLLRAGFELTKFRAAFTYNLIGKTDFVEGSKINNSYFGISFGFYLGGGKWKK
ncbi:MULTISPECIES: outer membrane beta-barrel protein [Flavobacteriaceae]|uniref:outer membrane beta-barrel protein n=1 Tax=Flavobacteriaceae TaxID=49546 RepID=UPI001491B0BA|nr:MULTISPECIES: outer membrane beta-barrel protein [Allomuricauda]MDC6367660.1 outer membrane beta-barrel protein [Muricauda sp. AC10]